MYSKLLMWAHGRRRSSTDYNRLSIGAFVIMTGTQGQVKAVWEGSCTETIQRSHVVCLKKRHQSRGDITQNTDPTEVFCESQFMGHPSVPRCILPIEEFHTPGLIPPTQPAVLSGALAWHGGIGDSNLPVSLPCHVNLPVMATKVVSLQAEHIEGDVKSPREVRQLLPAVCVGGAVTSGGDEQFRVSRLWIKTHLTGIWRHMFNTCYSE